MSEVPWTRTRERVPGGGTVMAARLECKSCQNHEIITLRKHLPPEVIAKKFGSMGWDVNRTNGTCFACRTAPHPKQEAEMVIVVPKKPETQVKTPPMAEPTMRQMRDIFEALEMYWSSEKGQYTGGYSDEKIGLEMSLPAAVIAKVRKEAFGDFKLNPEVEALMAEAKAIGEKVDAQVRSARSLTAQVETLMQSARDLRSTLDTIDLRINKLVNKGE